MVGVINTMNKPDLVCKPPPKWHAVHVYLYKYIYVNIDYLPKLTC